MTSDDKIHILYALGSNGSGQLGIGHDQDVSIPRQVLFAPGSEPASPIISIAGGGNHTLLLAADGNLYRAGDASTGACGLLAADHAGQGNTASTARKVALARAADGNTTPAAAPVKLIGATWEASIIVQPDEQGRATVVSTFGSGSKGELGLGQFIVRTPSASQVPEFPPAGAAVVDLSACMSHAVVVLDNGKVWGWGSGRKGQLGTGVDGVVHEPRELQGVDFKVARAVCGREFTVLLGSPDSGEVLVLGADKAGVKSSAPKKITSWRDVGASWGGVYILQEDGKLLCWGKNDHGQLAPEGLPKIKKLAVGSEHVVALTEDGDVLAWGWGEHGNCGPQSVKDDGKAPWNTIASKKYIPPGSEITAIGAGCATSWISIEMAGQP